ncbi:MAG: hypothetical protein R3E42_00915 [Burkholderiaceae bacterium]
MRIIDSPAPTPSSTAPSTMNGNTVVVTMENVEPSTPESRLNHQVLRQQLVQVATAVRNGPGQ